MITYAERHCFRHWHLSLRSRVEDLVGRVNASWGNELRCHELARAIHLVVRTPELVVVDGHCGPVEHSWLCFSTDGVIIDTYVPGRLPAVQIIDPLVGLMYRPGPERDDIRQPIVDSLVAEMTSEHITRAALLTTMSVIEIVAGHFTLKPTDLRGSRRTRAIADARAVAMYLARTRTKDSFSEIARAFGGRHHTTVLVAVKKIADQLPGDETLRAQIATIEQLLSR